jgi:hypothetical protein
MRNPLVKYGVNLRAFAEDSRKFFLIGMDT